MKRLIIYKLLFVFLLGCTSKETDNDCLVLNVKMEDTGISFNELFKHRLNPFGNKRQFVY